MKDKNISILDGSTFLVSSANGDVDAGPDQPHGLFYKDMRHLSKWKLTIKGIALDVLSTDALEYYYAQHFCVPPTGTIYKNPTISIVRRRFVGDGFVEELTVLNHGTEAEEVELRLEADADFADLFEVKDALKRRASATAKCGTGSWCWVISEMTLSARRLSLLQSRSRISIQKVRHSASRCNQRRHGVLSSMSRL